MSSNNRCITFRDILGVDESKYSNYYYKNGFIKDIVDYTYSHSGNFTYGKGVNWDVVNELKVNVPLLSGFTPSSMDCLYALVESGEIDGVVEFMRNVLRWKK